MWPSYSLFRVLPLTSLLSWILCVFCYWNGKQFACTGHADRITVTASIYPKVERSIQSANRKEIKSLFEYLTNLSHNYENHSIYTSFLQLITSPKKCNTFFFTSFFLRFKLLWLKLLGTVLCFNFYSSFVTVFSTNGQSLHFDYFCWVFIFLPFIIPEVCKRKGDAVNSKAFIVAYGSLKLEIGSFVLERENSFFGRLFSHKKWNWFKTKWYYHTFSKIRSMGLEGGEWQFGKQWEELKRVM